MKNLLVLTVFTIIPIFTLGSSSNDSYAFKDSSQQEIRKPLRMSGRKVYIEERLLSKDEVNSFLRTIPNGIELFNKGMKQRSTGMSLYYGGAVIVCGGAGLAIYSDFKSIKDPDYEKLETIGIAIDILGALVIGGGVLCTRVGSAKIRKSINSYNESIKAFGSNPGLSYYEIGLLDNGKLGFKVTF